MAWEAGPLALAAARRRPIGVEASRLGRRRRPLSFRAAILTGELVLEVPGRLAVAHHHDRRLLARAAAQGALGRAEQHRCCLELLELLLSTSAAVQRGPVSGVDALGMQRSPPSFTRETWQSQLISPQFDGQHKGETGFSSESSAQAVHAARDACDRRGLGGQPARGTNPSSPRG